MEYNENCYQLKHVRERLAKGLVDKGILRTEKRNFVLFDMATHPIADINSKEDIKQRIFSMLCSKNLNLPYNDYLPQKTPFRVIRTIALVCAAYTGNVLENVLNTIGHTAREKAFAHVDEFLSNFSQWPFSLHSRSSLSHGSYVSSISTNLPALVEEELENYRDTELHLEVVAVCSIYFIYFIYFTNYKGVLQVFTRLDSII